jgi:hypothetical protein
MPYGSDAARLKALKGLFGTDAPDGTVYFALLRHASTPATVLGSEPSSTGDYARVAISNVDASWTYGTASVSNTNEIRWPSASGVYSITDPLNQWAIYDNSAGGDCLAFGALSAPITVTGAGDVPVISALAWTVTQG